MHNYKVDCRAAKKNLIGKVAIPKRNFELKIIPIGILFIMHFWQSLGMKIQRSKELTDRFYNFLDNNPPQLFSRHLRLIFFGYLSFEMNSGITRDLKDHLWEISDLFDLLDCAEETQTKQFLSNSQNGL
jgi:hypothetical protein